MADLEVQHYRCLGELLRAHAGDARAVERLRELVAGELGDECVPMLAELATGDERRALQARALHDSFTETDRIGEDRPGCSMATARRRRRRLAALR